MKLIEFTLLEEGDYRNRFTVLRLWLLGCGFEVARGRDVGWYVALEWWSVARLGKRKLGRLQHCRVFYLDAWRRA